MKHLLALLLGIVVLSTVALADVMVPSVFTPAFRARSSRRSPSPTSSGCSRRSKCAGFGDVMLVSAGGDYEASLLPIDDIWSGGQIKVDGDIVVAVPARDVLLVTGSRNRAALKNIGELAAKYVAEGRYELTDTLFVYRDGRFSKFGR